MEQKQRFFDRRFFWGLLVGMILGIPGGIAIINYLFHLALIIGVILGCIVIFWVIRLTRRTQGS